MKTSCISETLDAIRERIHLHPHATTRDIIASLALDEIQVSVLQVRNVMGELNGSQDLPFAAVPAGMQRGFMS